MSYAVVRIQKMTKGSVRGIEIHDRRLKEGVSHSNPDIDWSRSDENFNLHPAQNENFFKAVKNRIESLDLKRAVRKDAVVMAQVLVTSDKDFFDELRAGGGDEAVRKFFQASYDFLADRYGAENIIAATVHLDERTPHMHFNFVPVTNDGRLCAKEVTAKSRLVSQQDAFREIVGKHYGLLRGEPKEAGKRRKHYETDEYKAAISESSQAAAKADELKKKNNELQAANEDAERQIAAAKAEARQILSDADDEAWAIAGKANKKSKEVFADTEAKAQQLLSDAERTAAEIIAKASEERDSAMQELNAINAELAQARSDVHSTRLELEQSERAIEDSQQKNNTLQGTLGTLEQDVAYYKNLESTLQKKITGLEAILVGKTLNREAIASITPRDTIGGAVKGEGISSENIEALKRQTLAYQDLCVDVVRHLLETSKTAGSIAKNMRIPKDIFSKTKEIYIESQEKVKNKKPSLLKNLEDKQVSIKSSQPRPQRRSFEIE